MSSNPLDDLRQINKEQMAADAAADTDVREPVDTVKRARVRKQGRKPVRTEASAGVSTPVQEDLRAYVRKRVQDKRTYPGGVKATLDMPQELSQRAKQYGLDHGNLPARQLLLELLDGYLTGEGY